MSKREPKIEGLNAGVGLEGEGFDVRMLTVKGRS